MIAKLANDTFLQSNAMNFMSFLAHGVDARTGQYSMRLELPPVHANDLRDIDVPLVFLFNSMGNENTGYGTSWQLQQTRFTPNDNMLTLASGETFKVTDEDTSTKQLLMREKKLDSFHLYRHGDDYRVVHRSGLVEVLKVQGSGSNRAAVPVRVASPLGHVLRLEYEPVNGGFPRLKNIFQADGEPVFTVRLDGAILSLNYYPDAPGAPGASYKMHVTGPDNLVSRIELPSDDKGAWDFRYRQVHGLWCMEHVTTPNGGKEQLYYLDEGHLLPGKEVVQIPRVTKHLNTPGLGQPTVDTRYTYPNDPEAPDKHNFLGYGLSDVDWSRAEGAGLDALYQHVGDYSYGSVETLFEDNNPVRTIERRFNQFHLQTLEKTTQGKSIQQTTTAYESMRKNVTFDEQPRTFQLATKTTGTWWEKNQTAVRRSEVESTSYDGQGNVLVKIKANKVQEHNTWYPATASEGHPEDPEGFVRHLRERKVVPATDNAATVVQRYTYVTRNALETSGFPSLDPCHLVDKETMVAVDVKRKTETELQELQYSYTDDLDNPFQHGRVSILRTKRNADTITSTFKYEKLDAPKPGEPKFGTPPLVQTTETTIGFDRQGATQIRKESAYTGLLHEEQDADNTITRYEYDKLGRVTRESIASENDEYPAERTYAYFLRGSSAEGMGEWYGQQLDSALGAFIRTYDAVAEAPGQQLTDALGVITRTYVDGLGRPVRIARDNIHSEVPKRLLDTHTLSYDVFGNKASETTHDWYLDEQKSRRTRYHYDDWNKLTKTISPEGVTQHEHTNPIGTVDHPNGPVIRRWTSGSDGKVSSRVELWMNLFEKPERTRRTDSEWKLLPGQERVQVYDGLGRCIQDTDERQYKTTYTYDAHDRMTSTLLPDSTRLEWAYASHSSKELPVSLTVTPQGVRAAGKVIASQKFDSLERLVSRTVGERTETYAFTGGRSQPDSHTTPAGDTIAFEYDLALTLSPKKSTLVGDDLTFKYHKITGNLLEAVNTKTDEGGKRAYGYNNVGQLTSETWTGPDGTQWETVHTISSGGLPYRLTRANTVETTYAYDDHLRLETSVQGQVKVSYQYDTLGRPWKITTQNTASDGETQVTEIEYDDYGRENKRTETIAGLPIHIVTQQWGKDELLHERRVKQDGTDVLHEVFTYDSRSRLTGHKCSGSRLPKDPFGQAYTDLTMTLDGYDNVKTTSYMLEGNPQLQRAQYKYHDTDPCQLESIAYVPAKPKLTFTYDNNGNLHHDERGFKPVHDPRGRMTAVTDDTGLTVATYHYDAHSHLYASQSASAAQQLLFFEENRLCVAVRGAQRTHLLYAADQPVAQQTLGVANDTALLQTNASGSVLCELRNGKMTTFSYGAYGDSTPSEQGLLGYNGELRETATGWYLLGRGYRAFNPVLMRFHSPDALSPFDGGGLNPYAYCNANPVTFRDPTGRTAEGWDGGRLRRHDEDNPHGVMGRNNPSGSSGAWLSIGLSAAFLAFSVISLGAALPGALATTAATITAVSLGASVVADAAALTMNIAGYTTQNEGLMKAGEIAMYVGIAVGAPAALIQGYNAVRAIAKWAKTPRIPIDAPSKFLLKRSQDPANQFNARSNHLLMRMQDPANQFNARSKTLLSRTQTRRLSEPTGLDKSFLLRQYEARFNSPLTPQNKPIRSPSVSN